MSNFIKKVVQCEIERKSVGLTHAIIWTAVLIATSWLMRGSEQADALFLIMVAAATTALLLANNRQKNQ